MRYDRVRQQLQFEYSNYATGGDICAVYNTEFDCFVQGNRAGNDGICCGFPMKCW